MFQQLYQIEGHMQHQNDALTAQVTHLLRDRNREDDNWRVAEEIARFQPYSPEVASVPIPDNLKVFAWTPYKGDKDPRAHLEYFNGCMVMHGAPDTLKCRLLPLIFRDSTQDWFNAQPLGSIINFQTYLAGSYHNFQPVKQRM